MANIKSQIKRNRQNDKRRLRNRVYRGSARTAVKEARATISDGDLETSKKTLLEAIRTLDKAAEKGALHKNNVARRKSRLMKQFAAMEPVEVKAGTPAEEVPTEPEKVAAPGKKRAAKKEPESKAKKTTTTRKAAAKPSSKGK